MLEVTQVLEVVERDVRESFGAVFSPTAGYALLQHHDTFEFSERDVPAADVSFVVWSYDGIHDGPIRSSAATTSDDRPIPVLDIAPDELTPGAVEIRPTHRPVRIVGTTLVLSRTEQEVDSPTLMRFIDWADVYAQLGFSLDLARVLPPVPDPSPDG